MSLYGCAVPGVRACVGCCLQASISKDYAKDYVSHQAKVVNWPTNSMYKSNVTTVRKNSIYKSDGKKHSVASSLPPSASAPSIPSKGRLLPLPDVADAPPPPPPMPSREQLGALRSALGTLTDASIEFIGGNLIPFFKNKLDFEYLVELHSPDDELQSLAFQAHDAEQHGHPSQPRLSDGQPVQNLNSLYDAAEACAPAFHAFISNLVASKGEGRQGVTVALPPSSLKPRDRAQVKARVSCGNDVSQLFDILRARLVCETAADATALLARIEAHDNVARQSQILKSRPFLSKWRKIWI